MIHPNNKITCYKCGFNDTSNKFPLCELDKWFKVESKLCINCIVGKKLYRALLRVARECSRLKSPSGKKIARLRTLIQQNQRLRNNVPKFESKRKGLSQRLRLSFGITVEQFETLFKEQDYKCPICGKSFPSDLLDILPRWEKIPIVVDHDHKTNKIRGLLCPNHNLGLGAFDDSPEYLRAAADYIEKHNNQPIGLMAESAKEKKKVRLKEKQEETRLNTIRELSSSQFEDAKKDHIWLNRYH
jgi:hypothetical protein